MGKVVAFAAVSSFVIGLLVVSLTNAVLGWDHSAFGFALAMGGTGAVSALLDERRDRRR